MSALGRPRILDDVKRGQIVALVTAGCGLAAAARFVSCSVDTIRREALRNEDFRRALRGGEVRAQLDPLQAMRLAAKSHWRAAAWLLERANPEQFGRRSAAKCQPDDLIKVVDAAIETAAEEIDDRELRDRVCRRLMLVATRATRSLAAAERSRLSGVAGLFELPTSAEQRALDKLLAEVEQGQASALRALQRPAQNVRKSA
jgi:hypothetical protein